MNGANGSSFLQIEVEKISRLVLTLMKIVHDLGQGPTLFFDSNAFGVSRN
jgi:hypothetical protein